jgi:hypothetical protein
MLVGEVVVLLVGVVVLLAGVVALLVVGVVVLLAAAALATRLRRREPMRLRRSRRRPRGAGQSSIGPLRDPLGPAADRHHRLTRRCCRRSAPTVLWTRRLVRWRMRLGLAVQEGSAGGK